jgi:hypothetical protein
MFRKILLGLLLVGMLFLIGGRTVKRGPGREGPVYDVPYCIVDAWPQVAANDCLQTLACGAADTCNAGGTAVITQHSINEPDYNSVTIHSLSCWYDESLILANAGMTVCVAYLEEDDTLTSTTICVDWADDADAGTDNATVIDDVAEVIPLNSFGLLVRVTADDDVPDSNFRGNCSVKYSGSG